MRASDDNDDWLGRRTDRSVTVIILVNILLFISLPPWLRNTDLKRDLPALPSQSNLLGIPDLSDNV